MPNKLHILIVEDNQDHLELLIDAFQNGYEVSYTDSETTCFTILNNKQIDLVVLDYYLKDKFSGLIILKKIHRIKPRLPVIMVTAYGDEDVAVEAIKSGARDYIRKTLDNSYINRIVQNVKEILSSQSEESTLSEKESILDFFQKNRVKYIKIWQEKIVQMAHYFHTIRKNIISEQKLSRLFMAFLADIQNEKTSETLYFFKKMILDQNITGSNLLFVELLNISIKEATREFLISHFPASQKQRRTFMHRIGTLVDENDLELSREYEKIMEESVKRMRKAERLSTKYVLMRTLQHEIRQPLSYIYNSAEMLLTGEYEDSKNEIINKILNQAKKIEAMLTKLEKDSHISLKKYPDQLPIVDLSSENA